MTFEPMIVVGVLIRAIFIYYLVMHGLYFLLIVLGAFAQKRYHKGIGFGEFKRISESSLSLPISIVICVYNEEKVILNTLLNVLQLRYPQYEVVVVNDGSVDSSMQLLIDHFKLRPVEMVFKKHFETKPVRAVYRSLDYPQLLVVDKENGRRADANNAGADYARYPIICQIDADCALEEDALLYMIRPFLLDSSVIAATGIIRPSNGITLDQGRIVERGLPEKWLPMFQVVEYLRSFQWSRAGLTRLNSMLCRSGAYTLIRKEVFIAVGGADIRMVVDDFELTVAVHRYIHEHKKEGKFKIAYVPDPGCYSEVPDTLKHFASQRNWWQRGILQSLLKNRDMAFNPRYGMAGMFAVPYYFIFEAIAPLIELCSLIIAPIAFFAGLVTLTDLLLFFTFGVVLGAFISVFAVLLQETTRMRQEKTRNLIRLLLSGFIEHFGYHQFLMVHKVIGIYELLVHQNLAYGHRERSGYNVPK